MLSSLRLRTGIFTIATEIFHASSIIWTQKEHSTLSVQNNAVNDDATGEENEGKEERERREIRVNK